MMKKGLILNEDIAILNTYSPNNRTWKYVKQKLTELQGKIEKCTVIGADFNTPLNNGQNN